MGKPLSQALGEVNGLVDRTRFVAVPLALALPLIAARSAVTTSLLHREFLYERRQLIALAPKALETQVLPAVDNLARRIEREPVGVVLAITPWNYPLLTTVNTVVPAVLAGDSVIIKMSPKTPLTARSAFVNPFLAAGAPDGLVSSLDSTNEVTAEVCARLLHFSRALLVALCGAQEGSPCHQRRYHAVHGVTASGSLRVVC